MTFHIKLGDEELFEVSLDYFYGLENMFQFLPSLSKIVKPPMKYTKKNIPQENTFMGHYLDTNLDFDELHRVLCLYRPFVESIVVELINICENYRGMDELTAYLD